MQSPKPIPSGYPGHEDQELDSYPRTIYEDTYMTVTVNGRGEVIVERTSPNYRGNHARIRVSPSGYDLEITNDTGQLVIGPGHNGLPNVLATPDR
jgi:hypothetical protein